MNKSRCELCEHRQGTYSEARKLVICEDCWQALRRQEARYDHMVAKEYRDEDPKANSHEN